MSYKEEETKSDRRLRCWESAFDRGAIEGLCPVCQCSTIRYTSTSGTTFQKLHIIPSCNGGSKESWNLVPGCGCNQNMGQYNLIDWMGTKGNKKSLIRPLFLRKYKSLVAPCHRSPYNRKQLLIWVMDTYNPCHIELYEDWLILLDGELASIQLDDVSTQRQPMVENTSGKIISPYFTKKQGK